MCRLCSWSVNSVYTLTGLQWETYPLNVAVAEGLQEDVEAALAGGADPNAINDVGPVESSRSVH